MFVIVKKIKNKNGIYTPVIIIEPTTNEILEFETYEDAEKLKKIFQANSNNGYEYEVKKL